MILKKEAIKKISEKLGFQFTGIEQDWAIEFSDSKRLNEFIKCYQEEKFQEEEKFALMALILSSYNDFLELNDENQPQIEIQINEIINTDSIDFTELIDYWSLKGETKKEMLFKITPFVRQIKTSH